MSWLRCSTGTAPSVVTATSDGSAGVDRGQRINESTVHIRQSSPRGAVSISVFRRMHLLGRKAARFCTLGMSQNARSPRMHTHGNVDARQEARRSTNASRRCRRGRHRHRAHRVRRKHDEVATERTRPSAPTSRGSSSAPSITIDRRTRRPSAGSWWRSLIEESRSGLDASSAFYCDGSMTFSNANGTFVR